MSEDKHLIWLIWIFFLLALQLIYSFTFRVLWLMQLESAHYNQGELGRSKTTNMFLITLLTNFRMTVFFSKISAEDKTLWRFEGACQVNRFDLSVWASWIIGRKIVRLEIGRDGQKSYPAALDMWTVKLWSILNRWGVRYILIISALRYWMLTQVSCMEESSQPRARIRNTPSRFIVSIYRKLLENFRVL